MQRRTAFGNTSNVDAHRELAEQDCSHSKDDVAPGVHLGGGVNPTVALQRVTDLRFSSWRDQLDPKASDRAHSSQQLRLSLLISSQRKTFENHEEQSHWEWFQKPHRQTDADDRKKPLGL